MDCRRQRRSEAGLAAAPRSSSETVASGSSVSRSARRNSASRPLDPGRRARRPARSARTRARADSPAARCARGGGGRRRSASARLPPGVRRSACSPSSAATIGAPWSAAAVAARSSADGELGVRGRRRRARGGAPGRAGRRRAPRAGDAPAVVRSGAQALVEHGGEQRVREADGRRRRARGPVRRARGSRASCSIPACRAAQS